MGQVVISFFLVLLSLGWNKGLFLLLSVLESAFFISASCFLLLSLSSAFLLSFLPYNAPNSPAAARILSRGSINLKR